MRQSENTEQRKASVHCMEGEENCSAHPADETEKKQGGIFMRKAVIDMGTNSTRLAIGEMMDGKMQIVYTQVAETRLGEGMGNERVIQPVPLERNVETVKRFAQTAQLLNAYDLRVTATSAVRDALNQDEVKQVISKAAGVQMEILPGAVEAQLSYLGASGDFQHLNRPLAVLDIGGGSTELVYPVEDGVHGASVNVGAVRLLEHPELRNETAQMLAGLKEASLPENCALIAVGGTNTCLMAMELGLEKYDGKRIHGQIMTKERVDYWCDKLMNMTQQEREQIPGMKAKRADIMPYGVLILQKTMEMLEVPEVIISDKGLVYGLLLSAF